MTLTLQQVQNALTHFKKNHGDLRLLILQTKVGVALVSIAQNIHTVNMDVVQDKSAEAMVRYAMCTLHNPNKKMVVDNSNVGDLLNITLLKDVVIRGVIL